MNAAMSPAGTVRMMIGVVSDGKFGDRAFEVIKARFPDTVWIPAPFPSSAVVDDLVLDIPDCDLYVSYAGHPDVILALVEKMRPVILGVSPGPGLVRQAREINRNTIAPVTMCSLGDTTGTWEIDEFSKVFGRPAFDISLRDGIIDDISVYREAPCGSTRDAAAELVGRAVSRELLQHFGLRICHHCRAPRFGRTCDKEFFGLHHVLEFIRSLESSGIVLDPDMTAFKGEVVALIDARRKALGS